MQVDLPFSVERLASDQTLATKYCYEGKFPHFPPTTGEMSKE